jgi:cytochrome c-type biogenesis protein CcmH
MHESLVFWTVAALLMAVAVACILLPLLRPARSDPVAAGAVNAGILRGQIDELERDVVRGLLPASDLEPARDELKRRALTEAVTQLPVTRGFARWLGPTLVVVALPTLAVVAYLALGAPGAVEPSALMADAAQEDFTARLQRHLREQPRDGRAWVLLARGHAERQQFADAAAAYERALAVAPKVAADAGVLCEYADALGMAQGRTLAGRPAELISQALALDPRHPNALEMAGSAAYEQRRYNEAAERWSELLAQLPSSSEQHGQLARAIDRARRKAAVSLPSG